ncbi:MAG: ABC transporter permease [Candidatus Omnitrophica bacterium]|nr:ABC transporter permease [Candidatus Omnitrophota bacterium]
MSSNNKKDIAEKKEPGSFLKENLGDIIRWAGTLGTRFVDIMAYIGGSFILLAQTMFWLFVPPLKKRQVIDQMNNIGVNSLPIVLLTGLFTGMVLALQSAYQMQKMSAEMYIASLVSLSMVRELGPVLTALVVAGRVGAAITAELGTMRVTEQIDALETLATNPVKYLVVPRFLALVFMLPLLTIYADFIGIIGGYIIGVFKLNIGSHMYMKMTYERLVFKDMFTGLIKSITFGMIIAIVACYQGMKTEGGAEGVGKSTTLAVVISFIMIIAADCFFTALFYFAFNV